MQKLLKMPTPIIDIGLIICIIALAITQPKSWILPVAVLTLTVSIAHKLWSTWRTKNS